MSSRKTTAQEKARGRLEKWSKAIRNNPSEKLARLWGYLAGTAGSVCDYSAEALRDRMKHMVAIITDDKKSMEKYDKFGDLCHHEHEARKAREESEEQQAA